MDHEARFKTLEAKIETLEGELGFALGQLTIAIEKLANKIDSVRDAVPIKIVLYMFMIVVLAFSGLRAVDKFLPASKVMVQ
jgi:hypothetical protein